MNSNCKLNYSGYTSFSSIDLSQTEQVRAKGIAIIPFAAIKGRKVFLDGDCDYCVIIKDEKSKRGDVDTKIVFRNTGNAHIIGYGSPRISTICFDNDGVCQIGTLQNKHSLEETDDIAKILVCSTLSMNTTTLKLSKTNIICVCRDSFVIGSKVSIDRSVDITSKNSGMFSLLSHGSSIKGMKVACGGSFCCEALSISDSVITPKGEITIQGSNYSRECLSYIRFVNTKIRLNSKITLLKGVDFGRFNEVYGTGDLVIKDLVSMGSGTKFNNSGDVEIIGVQQSYNAFDVFCSTAKADAVEFTNRGKVTLVSDKQKNLSGRYMFGNASDVTIQFVSQICGGVFEFMNGGSVYLKSLVTIPKSHKTGYLKFLNGKDVHLPLLTRGDADQVPIIKNGRNLIIRHGFCDGFTKLISPAGMIICGDINYYSNKSYIKRYNLKVEEGFVTLVKGVSKRSKKANYDKSTKRWVVGRTVEISKWNPYASEIGEGKFIGSFTSAPFKSLIRYKNISYVAIKVAVTDLYEWPSFGAKHPELIGFRKGTVLKEIDEYEDVSR